MEESKIERINRESAERRARGDYVPGPRETARDEARVYVTKAREQDKLGHADWVTAYATLALATLAVVK